MSCELHLIVTFVGLVWKKRADAIALNGPCASLGFAEIVHSPRTGVGVGLGVGVASPSGVGSGVGLAWVSLVWFTMSVGDGLENKGVVVGMSFLSSIGFSCTRQPVKSMAIAIKRAIRIAGFRLLW